MISTEAKSLKADLSASERLKTARALEPHPLYPLPGEVAGYVTQLQFADEALAGALRRAEGSLPAAEAEVLRRKRAGIDAAIARQVLLAGRRMGTDRQGSIATLNALFKLGSAPDPAISGPCKGWLVATTMHPAFDSFAAVMSRLWLPWKGKRFNSVDSFGDNIFTPGARIAGRLYWPTFSGYYAYKRGLYTSFQFATYIGPGVNDPEVSTLKLDYDNPSNPGFLVRDVLDELVQISGNYYLGKAYLGNRKGNLRLAAFFALRRDES